MDVEKRPVLGFPGYLIGSDGSVWSCWEVVSRGKGKGSFSRLGEFWRQLSSKPHVSGYPRVVLGLRGRSKHLYVHKLVLEAFVGPMPHGSECRHLDGNKLNCCVTNLSWGTSVENAKDRIRHGTTASGERNGNARLTSDDIREIDRRIALGETQSSIGRIFGVAQSAISNIKRRKRWKCLAR